MRVDEYRVLQRAFFDAWPFVVRRVLEACDRRTKAPTRQAIEDDSSVSEECLDAAWNEFCVALDGLGVTFDSTERGE